MLDIIIFWSQFAVTTLILSTLWVRYLGPYVRKQPVQKALTLLTVPLLFQHVDMTTLVRSVVNPTLAPQFGWTVSICNLVTIPLALLALSALRRKAPSALLLAWLLSAMGVLAGLATAVAAARYSAILSLGPHWYVEVLYLPMQGLCHLLTIVLLVQRGKELQADTGGMATPALA